MPRIEVDSDQLSALAARLLQVKQGLLGAGSEGVVGDAAGSAQLADSLAKFARSWAEGRQQICDGIDTCHADLASAAHAYASGEQTLARGLAPGGHG
jgi:hypothetical protein